MGIHPKKGNHPALSIVTLLNLFTNLRRPDRCFADYTEVLFLSQGPKLSLFVILLQTCLAHCCESCLVEFPLLYVAFFKSILAAQFSTISLLLLFVSSKPSCLDDHFTTQHSDLSSFLAVFFSTDKPVNRSNHAYALT